VSAIPVAKLKELSERGRVPLRRYFERRIRGNADAEDLVQEVFFRLARCGNSETIENLEGYTCRIAANLVRDYARRRTIHKDDIYIDKEGLAMEAGFSPERIVLGREAVRQVFELLDELPEKTRKIFVLYHIEVVPQVRIARMMDMPLSTIEKHMCRATTYLNHRLEFGSPSANMRKHLA